MRVGKVAERKSSRAPGQGRCRGTKWKKKKTISRCEPCGLTFTSAAQLADHEKGKKHALKMRWLARCEENPLKAKLGMKHTKTYTRVFCAELTTSFNLMKEHKAGRRTNSASGPKTERKAAIGILRKRKLLDEKATDPPDCRLSGGGYSGEAGQGGNGQAPGGRR